MENNANSPKKEDRGVNKVAKIPVNFVERKILEKIFTKFQEIN